MLAHGHKAILPVSKQNPCPLAWPLPWRVSFYLVSSYCSALSNTSISFFIYLFFLVHPWPAYFTSWWISLAPATPSHTVSSLSKALLSRAQEALWPVLEGADPCAMEWPKPRVVTSIPFVSLVWMGLFDERPNSKGNYKLGRLKSWAEKKNWRTQGDGESSRRQTKSQGCFCNWTK